MGRRFKRGGDICILADSCESCTIKKLSAEELMLLNFCVGKTLESLLDSKEIQPVNPKGNQS